jgi:hypothetical protein
LYIAPYQPASAHLREIGRPTAGGAGADDLDDAERAGARRDQPVAGFTARERAFPF